mmetsp:Transcript_43289/g.136810  ORF Transcript_43289/g.136810 Transcript_43289/m.136810 type:complete len:170 (+) Transcript_43289:1144-1653(+)
MFACLTLVSLLDRVPLIFILCSLLQGKIPVISDPTENTDTFFAFQNSNIIEMKSVIVAKSSQGLESALEKMRQKLVAALKSGNTLVLRLSNSTPDLEAYKSDEFFPSILFDCHVEEVEEQAEEQVYGGFGGKASEGKEEKVERRVTASKGQERTVSRRRLCSTCAGRNG